MCQSQQIHKSSRQHTSKPPKGPHVGAGTRQAPPIQGMHFYGSSLPKSSGSFGVGGHSYSRGVHKRMADSLLGTSPPNGGAVGWLMGATPPEGNGLYGSSPSGSMASSFGGSYKRHVAMLGSSPTGRGGSVPIPKFQHPSYALLEDNGFKQIKYMKWFKRCIEDRSVKGVPLAAKFAFITPLGARACAVRACNFIVSYVVKAPVRWRHPANYV